MKIDDIYLQPKDKKYYAGANTLYSYPAHEGQIMAKGPFISLSYITYRPGGIDLLAESLKHQPPELYELIVVDDFPGRVERGEAAKYIQSKGIPLSYYGPSKPHSYPDKKLHGISNAMNTAAMKARTSYFVCTTDYVWFPPGHIVQWITRVNDYQHNTLISGVASVKNAEPPHCHGDISIWHGAEYPKCVHHIHDESEEWIPKRFENYLWGCHVSFLEEINGIDERADTGPVYWNMMTLIAQASAANYHMVVDRSLRQEMINHRIWKNCEDQPKPLWHAQEQYDHEKVAAEHPGFRVRKTSLHPYSLKEERENYLESVGLRKIVEKEMNLPK
jgi:glycosyltransferase involved in cell wall biosynthesis